MPITNRNRVIGQAINNLRRELTDIQAIKLDKSEYEPVNPTSLTLLVIAFIVLMLITNYQAAVAGTLLLTIIIGGFHACLFMGEKAQLKRAAKRSDELLSELNQMYSNMAKDAYVLNTDALRADIVKIRELIKGYKPHHKSRAKVREVFHALVYALGIQYGYAVDKELQQLIKLINRELS